MHDLILLAIRVSVALLLAVWLGATAAALAYSGRQCDGGRHTTPTHITPSQEICAR